MLSTGESAAVTLKDARVHLLASEDSQARAIVAKLVQNGADDQATLTMLETLNKRALASWRRALRAKEHRLIAESGEALLILDLFRDEWISDLAHASRDFGIEKRAAEILASRALSTPQKEATYLDLFDLLRKKAGNKQAIEFGFLAINELRTSDKLLCEMCLAYESLHAALVR